MMERNYTLIAVITGAAFLFLWILPYLVLGEDAHITLHDNLDSEIIFNQLGAKYFFDLSGTIPEFINLDARALNTFSTFQLLLYAFLPPFQAYILNECIVRLAAYAGMYLLLSLICTRHFREERPPSGNPWMLVTLAVSVLFAWLPFYSVYGLTVAGMPMLAWAFYNVFLHGCGRDPKTVSSRKLKFCFLCIAFFGFGSALILSGWFILLILSGLCAYFLCKQQFRKKQIYFYLAAALLLAVYAACNLKLIMLMLSGYQSHREIWETLETKNFSGMILWFFAVFGIGRPHAGGHYTFIVLICAAAFFYGWFKDKKNKIWQWLSWVVLLNVIIAAANALLAATIVGKIIIASGLGRFRAARLFFMMPFTWYTAGALALAFIWEKIAGNGNAARLKLARAVTICVCALAFVLVSAIPWPHSHVAGLTNYAVMLGAAAGGPSWREFYDVNLFKTIDDAIGRDKTTYRTGSIGLPPAIAIYNGFYTVDAFSQNYSLEYWRTFRGVIAGELARNPAMDANFYWGNQCYLFASEIYEHRSWNLGMYNKNSTAVITTLDYDIQALRNVLGCEYIFSAVPILTPPAELEYVDYFEGAYLGIYLYKVII